MTSDGVFFWPSTLKVSWCLMTRYKDVSCYVEASFSLLLLIFLSAAEEKSHERKYSTSTQKNVKQVCHIFTCLSDHCPFFFFNQRFFFSALFSHSAQDSYEISMVGRYSRTQLSTFYQFFFF